MSRQLPITRPDYKRKTPPGSKNGRIRISKCVETALNSGRKPLNVYHRNSCDVSACLRILEDNYHENRKVTVYITMLLVRRRFIFTVLLAVAIRFPFALAKRNPASSFSHHHHHDSRKTSKNVFGLYERDGRPAERFELPTKSVSIFTSDICSDDGTTSTIKLPLQITATHGSLEKRSLSHMKASVLTLLLFGSIAHCWFFDGHRLFRFGTKANGSGKLVSVVIAILLYWIEAMTCSTRRYLGNALSPKKVQHYLETLKSVPPSVLWTIECYHYRTVYHRYGSARNHQKRQETTERIVTHRASQQYSFQR